jgi:hypothetical protein
MATKRFQTGSGCYTCKICGKQTRETGEGESGCKMCLRCYTASLLENDLSDGGVLKDPFGRLTDNADLRTDHDVAEYYDRICKAAERPFKPLDNVKTTADTCYNLSSPGEWIPAKASGVECVVLDPNGNPPRKGQPQWSGEPSHVPAIGDFVVIRGWKSVEGYVTGYFIRDGWLGVTIHTALGDDFEAFGAEIDILQDGDLTTLWAADEGLTWDGRKWTK